VAAVTGFGFIICVFFIGVFKEFVSDPGLRETLAYLNLLEHMDDFSRGIIDTRRLVYVASTVFFFLFLSSKALEANKEGEAMTKNRTVHNTTVGLAVVLASASSCS